MSARVFSDFVFAIARAGYGFALCVLAILLAGCVIPIVLPCFLFH